MDKKYFQPQIYKMAAEIKMAVKKIFTTFLDIYLFKIQNGG
jgi:hypothetical protein